MRRALLVLVACGGCASDVLVVDLPELGGAQSWLVARVDGEGRVAVTAHDADSGPLRFDAPAGALDLELWAYDAPINAVGLEPGAVAPAAAGAPSAALPGADRRFAARLDGAELTAPWAPAAGPPLEELTTFRRTVLDPCLRYAPTIGTLPTREGILWAASLGPERLLVGTEELAAIIIEPDTAPRRLPMRGDGRGNRPNVRSVFVDSAGRIWLGDFDGGLWRGTVGADELLLERVVPPTAHGPARRLAGDPDDPEGQLFTVTTSGAVARLDGATWRTIAHDPLDPGEDPEVHIEWFGPDEVVVASSGWSTIRHHFPDGRVVESDVVETDDGVTAMSRVGPRELGAGVSGGLVVRYRNGRWTDLGRGGVALDVKVFYPLPEGFLYAGVFGYVGQWVDGFGFCPGGDLPTASATIKFILPLGEKLFMVGDSPRGPDDPTAYTLLTLQSP